MKSTLKKCILSFFILTLVAITGCTESKVIVPEPLTNETAAQIAADHFFQNYGIEVSLKQVNCLRVTENIYQNCIIVRDKEQNTFELRLNEQNIPIADNFLTVKQVQGMMASTAFERPFVLSARYSREENSYQIVAELDLEDRPSEVDAKQLYLQAQKLAENGIGEMILFVVTPDFLLPPSGKLQLGAKHFPTDLSESAFLKEYTDWAQDFRWDRDTFQKIVSKAEELGGSSVRVYMENRYANNGIFLKVCYEASAPFSSAQEKLLTRIIDDSSFKIRDLTISVSFEHSSPADTHNTGDDSTR